MSNGANYDTMGNRKIIVDYLINNKQINPFQIAPLVEDFLGDRKEFNDDEIKEIEQLLIPKSIKKQIKPKSKIKFSEWKIENGKLTYN